MFSPDDNHIIVNYHYVRDPNPSFSGIFPCAVRTFEKQIKFLSERYRIVSVTDVWEAARAGDKEKLCALTFDDGLKDHHENVLPILKRHKATASFFFIASVFDEGRLPATHALHVLLSALSARSLADAFVDFLRARHPEEQERYHIPRDRRITNQRMHEDVLTANLKETLMRVPQEIKHSFISHALGIARRDEGEIRKSLFMGSGEMEEMEKNNMEIGAHSYAHVPLNEMDEHAVREDTGLAKKVLSGMCTRLSRAFSYPHGRTNDIVTRILKEEGFDCGVTIERRGVEKEDDAFLIPRYDAADLSEYAPLV